MSLLLVDGFDLYNNTADWFRTWTNISNNGVYFTTSPVRTGRGAMQVHNQGMYVQRIFSPAEEHVTYIAGFGVYRVNPDDSELFYFQSDGSATTHVSINLDNLGAIRVCRGPRTGVTLGTSATGLIGPNVWHYVEAKVTLSDTAGAVTVKVDNVQVLNLTGQDTKNAGTKTVFDSVAIGHISSPSGWDIFMDDVYVCNGAGSINNDLMGECRVRTLYPNGNGANSTGTGSDGNNVNNYQLVLDTSPPSGTASYVDLINTNDEDTYLFDDMPDIIGNVLGVQISTYGFKTDTGTRALAHLSRVSGTDFPSSDIVLGTSFGWQRTLWEQNPASAIPWTRNDVNGAEFGVRAR